MRAFIRVSKSRRKTTNPHWTRGVTPKCSEWRGSSPRFSAWATQTSLRLRAVGDSVSSLTVPGIEVRLSNPKLPAPLHVFD